MLSRALCATHQRNRALIISHHPCNDHNQHLLVLIIAAFLYPIIVVIIIIALSFPSGSSKLQKIDISVRERFIKKREKKLIKISFRYVRVAENFEKFVFFFLFSPTYFE